MKLSRFSPVCALLLTALGVGSAQGAAVFFGPTPYLSAADIPAGLYTGGGPAALEDFEDGTLDFGITVSAGAFVFGPDPHADSVDLDDGTLDGSGTAGMLITTGSTMITFFFPANATAAGVAWTDGPTRTTTFEAFGPGMVSLGTIGPFALGDGSSKGGTAEDRFFGARDPNGIAAIRLTNSGASVEADHVQFGVPLPTAAGMALALLGAGLARKLFKTRQ